MTDQFWTSKLRDGHYAANDALLNSHSMDWAVDGYLPAIGTTVWFGTGATGKTQLLLTLAAAVAHARSNRPVEWLGGAVNRNGRVLILSAEDLRGEILRRLSGIVRGLDVPADQETAICSRIHVLPFLSLTEVEFEAKNPCLFEYRDREWRPTTTLEGIEQHIEKWNATAVEGEKIVAVIMDSATTMAGFETTDSEATTNFLFYLNRLCVRLELSWSIIGHTPKEVRVDPARPQDNAIARLRGSAMWSTTPRSVIEVRLAHPDENLGDIQGVDLKDLVIVTVAKANNFQAQREPRFLKRLPGAGYEDITNLGPKALANSTSAALSQRDRDRLAEVLRMLRALVDRRGENRLSVRLIKDEFDRRQHEVAAFKGMDGTPNANPEKAAHGGLSWCLQRIELQGGARYRKHGYDIIDLDHAERRFEEEIA